MNREGRVERYEQWEKWIEDQEKSGLSRKEFCKRHELVLSQFAYYYGAIKAKCPKSIEDKEQLFARIQFNKPERGPVLGKLRWAATRRHYVMSDLL